MTQSPPHGIALTFSIQWQKNSPARRAGFVSPDVRGETRTHNAAGESLRLDLPLEVCLWHSARGNSQVDADISRLLERARLSGDPEQEKGRGVITFSFSKLII